MQKLCCLACFLRESLSQKRERVRLSDSIESTFGEGQICATKCRKVVSKDLHCVQALTEKQHLGKDATRMFELISFGSSYRIRKFIARTRNSEAWEFIAFKHVWLGFR